MLYPGGIKNQLLGSLLDRGALGLHLSVGYGLNEARLEAEGKTEEINELAANWISIDGELEFRVIGFDSSQPKSFPRFIGPGAAGRKLKKVTPAIERLCWPLLLVQ